MVAVSPFAGSLAAAALAVTAAGQDATPTPPADRFTWGNCKCKVNWQEEGQTCHEGCCNFDDDSSGDEYYYYYNDVYCYVEDAECEGADWGTCRPETMSIPGCTDYPPEWSDSDGDDCFAYQYNDFCTLSGGAGSSWDDDWGTFQSFTMSGHDASDACCACGGGSHTFQGYNDKTCADTAGWKDTDGDGCSSYSQLFYCTRDGKPGVGWHEEWGTLSGFHVNGVSALEACCACGGGTDGTYAGTEYKPRPSADTAGVVVPNGAAWAVASGPCTKDSSDCILSPNFPKPYGKDEKCVIGVNADRVSYVTAEPFATEWGYDTLTINGEIYSGTMGPVFVWPMGTIVWTSDYDVASKGWRLCQEGTAAAGAAGGSLTGAGYLSVESKAVGVALVLGVLGAIACACWCRMRKGTAPVIGHGVPQDED